MLLSHQDRGGQDFLTIEVNTSSRISPTKTEAASGGELRHHIGRQALHLLQIVEQRVEDKELCPGGCHLAQRFYAFLSSPGRSEGIDVRQPEVSIQSLQSFRQTPAGALPIVVHRDVDALGDPERRRVATQICECLANDLDLPDDHRDARVHLLVVRPDHSAMYVAHRERRWQVAEGSDWWNRWKIDDLRPNLANLCRTCVLQLAGTPRPVLRGDET